MTITSNFPTSKDVIARIPDAPFNQNQTILVNGVPMTHRDLMNFLFDETENHQDKMGAGNSLPTTVGHVPRVTSAGVTTYGLITPVNVGVIPRAKIRYAGNQNVADNAQTFLVFNTVDWDTDTCYAAGTPGRLTVKTAGLYHLTAQILLNGPVAGRFNLEITRNAARTKLGSQYTLASASSLTMFHVCTDYLLAVNDYVECSVTVGGAGGASSVDGTVFPNLSPTFSMTWVCP